MKYYMTVREKKDSTDFFWPGLLTESLSTFLKRTREIILSATGPRSLTHPWPTNNSCFCFEPLSLLMQILYLQTDYMEKTFPRKKSNKHPFYMLK